MDILSSDKEDKDVEISAIANKLSEEASKYDKMQNGRRILSLLLLVVLLFSVIGNYLLIDRNIDDIGNNTFIYNDIVYNYTIINKEDSQNIYLLPNHKFKNNETIIIKIVGNKQSLIKYIFNNLRKDRDNI